MKTLAATVLLVVMLALTGAAAHGAVIDDITIEAAPSALDIPLGETTVVEITVTNNGSAEASGVIAHIDITDLADDGSVDAEDWSSVLSKPVPSLAPGQSTTLRWDLQPISPGDYTLYAVALSPASSSVAATDTVAIAVADRRSLNPNGILPIAVGAPVLVGLGLTWRLRRMHTS